MLVAAVVWLSPPLPAIAGDLIAHFHGRYCGTEAMDPTFRTRPIDALDAACMRHDRCYRNHPGDTGGCDAGLARAASRLENSPRLNEDVRRKAGVLDAVFSLLSGM